MTKILEQTKKTVTKPSSLGFSCKYGLKKSRCQIYVRDNPSTIYHELLLHIYIYQSTTITHSRNKIYTIVNWPRSLINVHTEF